MRADGCMLPSDVYFGPEPRVHFGAMEAYCVGCPRRYSYTYTTRLISYHFSVFFLPIYEEKNG
jgi:hypothetical protein